MRVEPTPISLIKINHDDNSDKDIVKLKLRRDPKSSFSYLYEFNKHFFDNVNLEEFLLFVQNFIITLVTSGTLAMGAKIQYLHTIVCGKLLRHFDLLYADVEGADPLTIKTIILGLALYCFPVNFLLKKKRANINNEAAKFKS